MRRTIILMLVFSSLAFLTSFLLSLSDSVQATVPGAGGCHLVAVRQTVCEEVCNGTLCGYDEWGMPRCCTRCYEEYVDRCESGYTAGQRRCTCEPDTPN